MVTRHEMEALRERYPDLPWSRTPWESRIAARPATGAESTDDLPAGRGDVERDDRPARRP